MEAPLRTLKPEGDTTTRFMIMHEPDKDAESCVPRSKEYLAEIGKYIEEGVKTGVLLSTEGLQPSSQDRERGRILDMVPAQ